MGKLIHNEVESSRNSMKPRAFFNYCKHLAESHGIDIHDWVSDFRTWGNPDTQCDDEWNNDDGTKEICRTLPYNWQFYRSDSYNFIMEFEFYTETKGTGYMYIAEWEPISSEEIRRLKASM